MRFVKTYAICAFVMAVTQLAAQEITPSNVQFAKTAINKEFTQVFEGLELPRGGAFAIAYNPGDSVEVFAANSAAEALREFGYDVRMSDSGKPGREGSNLRILGAEISIRAIETGGGFLRREIAGEIHILVYSLEGSRIVSGEEATIIVSASDRVSPQSYRALETGSPGFLRSGTATAAVDNRFRKLIMLAVAGVVTYLFYTVRG